MSCVTLIKSRKLACNSPLAGIRAIGIGAYDAATKIVTTNTGVIDLATSFGASSIARLEVKNTTTKFLEKGISGGDNRSTAVSGEIMAIFNVPAGGDLETTKLVEELLKGDVVLFLERKDGVIMCAGSQNGAEAVTADSDTGGNAGDLNGFTVTFKTLEADYARKYVLAGDGLVDYAAALMAY